MRHIVSLLFATAAFACLAACSKEASDPAPTQAPKASPAATPAANAYQSRGTIKSFGPDRKLVNISHEAIPGYMAAMTMSFEPKDIAQFQGLGAGDKVSFTFSDDAGRRVISAIAKLPLPVGLSRHAAQLPPH